MALHPHTPQSDQQFVKAGQRRLLGTKQGEEGWSVPECL